MVDNLIQNLINYGSPSVYFIFCLSAFVENLFPPFPGDVIVLFGGLLIGRGGLAFLPVYGATVFGSWAGFMLVYYLGLAYGRGVFDNRRFSFLSAGKLEKVEEWFARYGDKVILINRFLSGIRSVVALFAGIGGMRPLRVAFYALLSVFIWNGLLLYLGMTFGSQWEWIVGFLRAYSFLVMLAVGVAVMVFLLRHYQRRRLPGPVSGGPN